MTTTPKYDERVTKLTFARVYTKVEKKGRIKEELHQVITWLTSFDEPKIKRTYL